MLGWRPKTSTLGSISVEGQSAMHARRGGRAVRRFLAQHRGRQPSWTWPLAEVHGARRRQDARAGRDRDHIADARTEFSTSINNASSVPTVMRTTAPASRISILGGDANLARFQRGRAIPVARRQRAAPFATIGTTFTAAISSSKAASLYPPDVVGECATLRPSPPPSGSHEDQIN